jgi:hypothetical protein
MKPREAYKIGLAVVLCGLSLRAATLGQDEKPRQVKDEAKLFSATAIDEANAIIAKVRDKHRKDLVIETMEKGPVAKEAGKWAANRAVDQRVDGIYVVISREPRHFEVVVSKKTQESGFFLAADRDKMAAILREHLGKDRDEALLKIARFALDTLEERAKTAKTDAPKPRLVKDEAMLFSKDAVEEVNTIVTKIKEQHGKDLFIETVADGPDKEKALVWARERSNELKVDGVYLVIAKKPGFFRIVVGDATLKKLFTRTDIVELEKILSAKESPDKKIVRAATYTLEAMSKANPPAPKDVKERHNLRFGSPQEMAAVFRTAKWSP